MIREATHLAKVAATYLTGRAVVTAGVGGAAAAGLVGASFIPFLTIPLGSAVLAYITRMNTQHETETLLLDYRNELAARLGKKPNDITMQDLQRFADGDPENGIRPNPVLAQELKREKMSMRVYIGTHTAAAAVAVGVTALALVLFSPIAPLALGLSAMVTCIATDFALESLAERKYGLNEPTAHRRIREIARAQRHGTPITRAQLFEVFVDANPMLAEQITQRFGKPYYALDTQNQAIAMAQFGQHIPLAALTQDINNRQVRATELVFAACGERSGLPRLEAPPATIMQRAEEAAHKAAEHVHAVGTHLHQKAGEWLHRDKNGNVVMDGPEVENGAGPAEAQLPATQLPSGGFVDRLGLAPRSADMSQVARLEQKTAGASAPAVPSPG